MTRLLPVLAAAIAGVLVGAATVATRYAINEAGPASLALLRYAIGFCCLLPAALAAGRVRFEQRDLVPIALLGVTQFGILIALLNYGLLFIPASRAALIFSTMPLLTMALAAMLGQERFTVAKTLGILATIAGVAVTLGEKSAGGAGHWRGELACFASAGAGAVCSVLYRPYLRKYPTLPVSAFAMLASVVFLAALAAGEGFWTQLPHFSTGGALAVLFIGVNSGIGYFLWLWALGHAPASEVTVFLALSPVTAALLGPLLLAEPVSATSLSGLALVAGGLVLAHRR